MRRNLNKTYIEGYLYEHNLELKEAGPTAKNPGAQFIQGDISIATDEQNLNVVKVHYSYVTALTSKGKANPAWSILMNIIEGKIGSIMEHGKENAGKLTIDSSIGLAEWPDREDGRIVTVKRNEGGFIHQVAALNEDEKARATFDTDILIVGTTHQEPDAENNIPEKVIVKGYVFDYKNALLPVEFSVTSPNAMVYFENIGATSKTPMYTRVRGIQISQTIVREISEESAFGDAAIRKVRSSNRDFIITWSKKEPYEWDSDETMLVSEFSEALQNREIHLAEIKKRNDERTSGTPAVSNGGYDF